MREAAKRFDVSVASTVRIGQLARAGHGLAARKIGGNCPPILLGATEATTRRLAAQPDWTVRALAADLKDDGIEVSHDTVWRFPRRRGLTFKNTLLASERERPSLARQRTHWRTHQHRADPPRPVFVDVTSVKTNMTRAR